MDVIARTPSDRAAGARSRWSCLSRLAWSAFLLFSCLGLASAIATEARAASEAPPSPVASMVEREGRAQLEARLVRSHSGEPRVGVLFDLAPGWHIYWRSSGDTGLPPELEWEVDGAEVGEIQWPLPEAFLGAGSDEDAPSYGYEGRVLLSSALGEGETRRLAVAGDVLVCEYECVPATFRLERGPDEPVPGFGPETEDALFRDFEARLPAAPARYGAEVSVAWSQSAVRPGDRFAGAIGIRSCTSGDACNIHAPDRTVPRDAVFFPDDRESVRFRVSGVFEDASDPRLHWIELAGEADAEEPIDFERLTGVAIVRDQVGRERGLEVDLPFPGAPAGAEIAMLGRPWEQSAQASPSWLATLRALALALLGGLVLNLMPCVLPVLAIKVFSIQHMAEAAREDRSEPLRHGLAYTAGILASMGLLASVVVALRAAGRSVGWGFQFQEPLYVAGISAVLVAFALNLFGTFEIQPSGTGRLAEIGQDAAGARRSFFEGLLAVALATPCSAPFLGTAVGFAFASPPFVIVGIFLAIGMGLAAPFLLVSLAPSLARFMPRSGSWMQVVRAGLGFALLATVIWLLWVFGNSAGADGIVALMTFLLALAFALWGFGQVQHRGHPRAALFAGALTLLVAAGGLNAVGAQLADAPAQESERQASLSEERWQTWSQSAVQAHLDEGRAVFVRFTADWCITCKVNERVALADPEVLDAFTRRNVALLVGDWTQRDDAIRAELGRHGRAGVPLYLLYDPERPGEPELLPELLTADRVLSSVESLSGVETARKPADLKPPARVGR